MLSTEWVPISLDNSQLGHPPLHGPQFPILGLPQQELSTYFMLPILKEGCYLAHEQRAELTGPRLHRRHLPAPDQPFLEALPTEKP